MTWNPTNANDVQLIVSRILRDELGSRTDEREIAETGSIVVDEFSIDSDEDLEGLSGIGNPEALGISRGDVEHSFSFTVQGEDAELFNELASLNGRANELEILVRMEDYKDKLVQAYAGTRSLSGSSGDATEYEVEGIAVSRDPGEV
jgi:hypothetical protein